MSDLCAPIYVVCGADEAVTFWCFVSVMDRMVRSPSFYPVSGPLDHFAELSLYFSVLLESELLA